MTKEKQTALFERIAFEAQLREHPGDTVARDAFVDWLADNGYTIIGAKRVAYAVVRIETERRQLKRFCTWFNESSQHERMARRIVRGACSTRFQTQPTINYIAGSLPPTWIRDGDCYRDDHGYEWPGPQGNAPANVPCQWVPLTEVITVGAGWVLRALFPNGEIWSM